MLLIALALMILSTGCSTSGPLLQPTPFEAAVRQAKTALKEGKWVPAHGWAEKALKTKPQSFEAQQLMAKIIDHELAQERFLSRPLQENPSSQENAAQIKTWLERGQSFLRLNQFDRAMLAAQQIFQLDPENLEASRLMDDIKAKARQKGVEEKMFLDHFYQQEINSRLELYLKQAEDLMQAKRWGSARMALEKIFILDSKNRKARRILALLDEQSPDK